MKQKILLLTIITIFSVSNILAQYLTFPSAEIFTLNITDANKITTNDSLVIVKANSELFIVDKGEYSTIGTTDININLSNTGCVGTIR